MSRWLASLVTSRPDLYRAIYDLNAYPHRWAAPGWLEELGVPAPAIPVLEQTPRGRERLSRHYCQRLGLDETYWEFADARRRLVLLETATLQRLAAFAGAALHAADLVRIVVKVQRRAITTRIGEDAFAFGVRHAARLKGRATIAAASPAPIATSGAAAEVVLPPESRGDADRPLRRVHPASEFAATIEADGWHRLADCLRDTPPALQRRFALKAPRALELFTPTPAPVSPADAWHALQPVLRDVLTVEEARCFS